MTSPGAPMTVANNGAPTVRVGSMGLAVAPETMTAAVLRAIVATGVLMSAAVHLDLYAWGGEKHVHVVGTLFLLNFVAGLVLGFAVQIWHHWIVVFLCAGFALTTVLFFYASVIWGLWGYKEVLAGPSQTIAQVVEWVAFLAGGVLLLLQWSGKSRRT
jgi:hypothetical protein